MLLFFKLLHHQELQSSQLWPKSLSRNHMPLSKLITLRHIRGYRYVFKIEKLGLNMNSTLVIAISNRQKIMLTSMRKATVAISRTH